MRLFVFLAGLLVMPLLLASQAFAQDGYRIHPGDVLRIEVLEDATLNRTSLVPPDGRISLPLAGAVKAAGRSVEDVQAELASRLASNFATPPNVFVSIEKIAERIPAAAGAPAAAPSISVYVMGEAAKSGKLSVAPGTTMLQMFAEMGGFSKFAATKRIQLRRADKASGEEKVYSFNYKDIERGANKAGNTVLMDGDVILVPQRKLFE
ncbi:MAG: polysaccharide biosynthesis/export family protein [Microgenomates group bacterium]